MKNSVFKVGKFKTSFSKRWARTISTLWNYDNLLTTFLSGDGEFYGDSIFYSLNPYGVSWSKMCDLDRWTLNIGYPWLELCLCSYHLLKWKKIFSSETSWHSINVLHTSCQNEKSQTDLIIWLKPVANNHYAHTEYFMCAVQKIESLVKGIKGINSPKSTKNAKMNREKIILTYSSVCSGKNTSNIFVWLAH